MTRALLLSLLTLGACWHSHRPWNAPGIADVATPPADLAAEQPEAPGDPGERMVMMTFGGFSGGGVAVDDGSDTHGTAGVEVSVHRGVRERSHYHDDFFVVPFEYEGLNLGWSVDFGGADAESGPIYLEAQRARLFAGGAAGWAFDPNDLSHGPQVTLFYASLYVRAAYMFGDGLRVHAGMVIKLPRSWVWSR